MPSIRLCDESDDRLPRPPTVNTLDMSRKGNLYLHHERGGNLCSVTDDLQNSSGPKEPSHTVIHGKDETSFPFFDLLPPSLLPFYADTMY
jgi:hypothetical protein